MQIRCSALLLLSSLALSSAFVPNRMAALTRARSLQLRETADALDISVPYDAAAKLAYEASDKSMEYEAFKADYEAKAVADVIAKKTGAAEPAAPVLPPPPAPVVPPPAAPPAPAPAAAAKTTTSSPGGALVPINEETVEFTAGLAGGVAGLVLGGPVLALIAAAAANYVSRTADKSDGEAGVIVNAVSTKSIEVYNWLAKMDAQYELLSNSQAQLESTLNKLKQREGVNPETIQKVEDALAKTTATISKVNDEYDLVGSGKIALGVIGELVEKTVTKVSDLNEENQLTDKALAALKKAVDQAKETAAKAQK